VENRFDGAEVVCWSLIPKFSSSNPAEAVGFLKGDKNPQHAFLRKGSNYRSHVADLRHVKEPWVHIQGIIWPPFPPTVPPVAARGATAVCGREMQLTARVGTIRNTGMIQLTSGVSHTG
jgi:hypothetical protein